MEHDYPQDMHRVLRTGFIGLTVAMAACSKASQTTTPPAVPKASVVRDCASRVEGQALRPDPKHDVTVGPVTFYGLMDAAQAPAREFKERRGRSPAWKNVTEVDADTDVTVKVSADQVDQIALIYDNFDAGNRRGEFKLSAGSPSVLFEGCPASRSRFSGPGSVGPRTQFNGGWIVSHPDCFDIAVQEESEDPIQRRIAFGTAICS